MPLISALINRSLLHSSGSSREHKPCNEPWSLTISLPPSLHAQEAVLPSTTDFSVQPEPHLADALPSSLLLGPGRELPYPMRVQPLSPLTLPHVSACSHILLSPGVTQPRSRVSLESPHAEPLMPRSLCSVKMEG